MLKYVQQGEPFSPSASQTNAFVDAAIYVRKLRHGVVGQSTVPASDDFLPVWIRNSTGLPVVRWGVLKIGDPVVLPSDNQADFEESIIFEGVLPTVSDDDTHAIVVQQLEANQVGVAILSGITTVKVNVTDVAHRRAKTIASDAAKLESGDVGAFKILWKESGTGEKWAKVFRDSAFVDICNYFHNLPIDTFTDGNGDYFIGVKNDIGTPTCVRVLAEDCP